MKILRVIDKIPGGIVLVPMAVTAIINTLCPQILNVGGITSALFSSEPTMCFIGVLLFLAGSQLTISDIPAMLKRGGILTVTKLLIAVVMTFVYIKIFPTGHIFGISTLAFCVVACSLNPGPFLAVSSEHGDSIDPPGFALYNLIVVPAVPALILGFTDGANMDWTGIITTLVPFLLGFIISNIDKDFMKLFEGVARPVLFFAGFAFGSSVDLAAVLHSGLSGILLSAIYVTIFTGLLYIVDRYILHQPGYASISLSSVSPASVAMPAVIATSLPQYSEDVASATAQIATSAIITVIVSVILTKLVLKHNRMKTTN